MTHLSTRLYSIFLSVKLLLPEVATYAYCLYNVRKGAEQASNMEGFVFNTCW